MQSALWASASEHYYPKCKGARGTVALSLLRVMCRAYAKGRQEISGFGVTSDGNIHYEADESGKTEAVSEKILQSLPSSPW